MEYEGKIWRILTNTWTVVAIILFTFDFASANRYDSSMGAVAAIYIAILSIYVGTKEFERWQSHYSDNYYGEIYVIIWTIFVLIASTTAPFTKMFQVPTELVIVYTVVLSIFALSRRSKTLYFRKGATQMKPLANYKKYVKVKKRQKRKNNEKRNPSQIFP
ncbi:MAG: hypothetical protein ABIB97_04690 [Patescibacteria group bacterium]